MNYNALKTILRSILFVVILSISLVQGVHAQTSISGDSLCGSSSSTVCTPADFKQIGIKVISLCAYLGGALLAVFVVIRLLTSVSAYMRGDSMAIKRAGEAAFNAFIGFFIIFAIGGGVFLLLLQYFGVQPWVGKLIQLFSSVSLIEHAYAVDTILPNPLGSNSAYDLILAASNLAMRFFVYPALIVIWVAAGFKFVYSQGNPEGLKTARSWLLWALIVSLVSFSLQGFIYAFRATAKKIDPSLLQDVGVAPQGKVVGMAG